MAESAFGVEHGEISKSYKKLARKMAGLRDLPKPTDSLQDRQKVNYVQWRRNAGALRNHINPKRYEMGDKAASEFYGKPFPTKEQKQIRARDMAADKAKARRNKVASQAMITGHANAGKRDRFLP